MAHHFGRVLRPMMLTHPNECGQGKGKDAASEGGRRGDSAINRGAFHQGPNDAEIFLSTIPFVHFLYFVIQSLNAGKKNYNAEFLSPARRSLALPIIIPSPAPRGRGIPGRYLKAFIRGSLDLRSG